MRKISLIFLLIFNIMLNQFVVNQESINNIGKINNEYISILISDQKKVEELINYAQKNELNIAYTKYNNDQKTIYQLKSFDPYKFTKNKFDRGLVSTGNKTNIIESNTVVKEFNKQTKINPYSVINVTTKNANYKSLKVQLENKGYECTYVKYKLLDSYSLVFSLFTAILIAWFILEFVVEYTTNKKKYNIFKLYSDFKISFRYLYLDKLIITSIFVLIIGLLLYSFIGIDFNILFKNLGLYIIVNWIIALIVSYLLNKRVSIVEIKGQTNLKIVLRIFKSLVFIVMLIISFTGYYILGTIDDSTTLIQTKANWKMNQDYVNLLVNDNIIEAGLDGGNANKYYRKLSKQGAIYFDNAVYLDYERQMYGETSNKITKKVEIDKKSSIKVNNNYLKQYNLGKYISNSSISILIPKSKESLKTEIKQEYCSFEKDEKTVVVKDCNVTIINDKAVYVGAKLDSNNNGNLNSIIVVYRDDFIEKNLEIEPNSLFIKINNKLSYEQLFKEIEAQIGDKKFFSEKGRFDKLFSLSLESKELVLTMLNFQKVIKVFILIIYLVALYIIYSTISIYLNSNIMKIAIKKISGYSIHERYLDLIYFLCSCVIGSVWLVWLYLLITKSGYLTILYFIYIILLNLSILIISGLMIRKLENKKIVSILKGDDL